MRFTLTDVAGAYLIELEKRGDERGFFARAWCKREFEEHGLCARLCQANVSFNRYQGTLRGLHFQRAPHAENKLVRCTRGAIFDVALDLRPESPSFRKWVGFELSAENGRMLYVPEGCAHGYQTLRDNCEVFYQVTEFYAPEDEGGVAYDDPAFGIRWPLPVTVISDRDKNHPRWNGA